MLPSTEDKKLMVKYLAIGNNEGGQRTRRSVKFLGQSPDSANSWEPGRIASTFSKLGFNLETQESLAIESWFFSIAGEKVTDQSRQSNSNNTGSSNNEVQHVNNLSSKSKKIAVGNFNPPRRFSPPRQLSKDVNQPVPSGSTTLAPNSGTTVFDRYTSTTNNKNASLFTTISQPPRQQHVRSLYDGNNETNNNSNTKDKMININANKWSKKSDHSIDQLTSLQEPEKPKAFKTAHEQLVINDRAQGIKRSLPTTAPNIHVSGLRKVSRFDGPSKNQPSEKKQQEEGPISDNPEVCELMQNPLMKNIEPKMVETILNEVFDVGTVDWDDIAGLQNVKSVIREIIIYPLLRPDIFTGLRGPPKGILLFGPPGTGKTMIGRLISTQSKSSFFNISASSLTSKWIGDGEKMVRALFATARVKQPAVIFIDEIDSILTQRSESEHESSRRLKTEFLIQFDGCGTKSDDRILVVGVTNRPQELDEAARRRLTKRIYIPLPDPDARNQLVKCLLKKQMNDLSDDDFGRIAGLTNGYSGADMATLCQEASYGPIRDSDVDIQNICAEQVRPMELKDFLAAIKHVKASVDQNDLLLYEDWDHKFGCHL